MKKIWLKPELSELSVIKTEEQRDSVGRPIPDLFPGYITCHEPGTGHPVKAYVTDLAQLLAFYEVHDACEPDGFLYEYRPTASA